ncbi:hypothetical protein OHC33_009056 [Knufia fluminis]|uniref:F-box domain-containing protein n=1 Tax=Knufia fluminis TaxID=191047 RepID=A0AAN8F221_9EURO|nr:hypothetical protein OHC33_009056 [Knufia fluminis]
MRSQNPSFIPVNEVDAAMTADSKPAERPPPTDQQSSRTQTLLRRLLQERATEWYGVAEKSRPLQLLDLPFDILQCVVSHVSHTNDLTSLALVHSSLHGLVTPHIYSRFDIVWPEANPTVESRVGVDALTYGLATLVMAHDVFGEAPYQQQGCRSCQHCQDNQPTRTTLQSRNIPTRIRRGNYFAQHTRKFSLGNGPSDWVAEYLITKEGGKMLGTLVALALGRMRNLEAFTWDMPTGVLRDVWLALASLGNRNDGQDCRLEKVWVRWHDNRDAGPPPGSSMHHANLPSLVHGTASSLFHIPPYPTVEFPTFSILPPLKSISVLDIDEVPYAEELSILLERSLDRLQELRVGIALHAQRDVPFRPIEDRSGVPPPFLGNDEPARPGGILGILVGRFCSAFAASRVVSTPAPMAVPLSESHPNLPEDLRSNVPVKDTYHHEEMTSPEINQLGVLLSAQTLQDDSEGMPLVPPGQHGTPVAPAITPQRTTERMFDQAARENQSRKLRLTVLELERIYLSIPVLSRSIDWARLESLTLLGCMNHEQLWKALRKTFTPAPLRNKTPLSKLGSAAARQRSSSTSFNLVDPSDYKLNIRRIHTDTVSKALLTFIKDTLAPDTLEWLFLQETNAYKSTVTIDEIYRSAVRRHRSSLRKLLIDSELKDRPILRDRERERDIVDTSWKRWICHQDLITCITSGKMQLRELSLSIDYKNWHYFLQRLPNATNLRSLHISHIADHPYGRPFDPRDVALQVLDIVALRSEIELCYLGVEKKCFEILEYKSSYLRRASPSPNSFNDNTIGITTHTMVEDDEDEDHDDGGAAHHIGHVAAPEMSDDEGDNWEMGSHTSSGLGETDEEDDDEEADGQNQQRKAFRLREILFYDDKISIFKARHGKL